MLYLYNFVHVKKNIFHIILSLLLTIAVTDYIWYDLLQGEKLAIELETDAKEKAGSEVVEDNVSETKDLELNVEWPPIHEYSESLVIFSGLIKQGNSFSPVSNFDNPKLFLLNCQLRIPCRS